MANSTRRLHPSIVHGCGMSLRQSLDYTGQLPPIQEVEFRGHSGGAKPQKFQDPDQVRNFMLEGHAAKYSKVKVKFRGYDRAHSASVERVWEKTMLVVMGRAAIVAAPEPIERW